MSNYKYQLTKSSFGQRKFVEIDQQEFCKIKKSRSILSAALSLEQVYDFYVSNLNDFEKELLLVAVDDMLQSDFSHNYFYSINASVGRRLANLLTSARSYFDQAPRFFAKCVANKNGIKTARTYMSLEYDSNSNYRVMEALRNHVQHQDVDVLSNTIGGRRDPKTGHMAFSVAPHIQGKRLLNSKKTKSSVRPDINENMDLRMLVRSYSQSISNIHKNLRSESKENIDSARSVIDQYIDYYKAAGDISIVALVAEDWSQGTLVDRVPILVDWDNTRQWLVSRNSTLGDYSKHYVTGKLGE